MRTSPCGPKSSVKCARKLNGVVLSQGHIGHGTCPNVSRPAGWILARRHGCFVAVPLRCIHRAGRTTTWTAAQVGQDDRLALETIRERTFRLCPPGVTMERIHTLEGPSDGHHHDQAEAEDQAKAEDQATADHLGGP